MEHRTKFSNKKLAEIFPPSLGYHFEKMYEAVHRPEYAELGKINVSFVQEVVESFKEELRQRDIAEAYDGVNYTLELLEYPLSELKAYFQGSINTTLNEKSAYIFIHFARDQMKDLEDMAAELDEDYSRKDA